MHTDVAHCAMHQSPITKSSEKKRGPSEDGPLFTSLLLGWFRRGTVVFRLRRARMRFRVTFGHEPSRLRASMISRTFWFAHTNSVSEPSKNHPMDKPPISRAGEPARATLPTP